MWSKDTRNFLDHVGDNLEVGDKVETGFVENYYASMNNEFASGLTISKFIQEAPFREQESKLRSKARTDPELQQFRQQKMGDHGYVETSWDYDSMTQYLMERGDEDIQDPEAIRQSIKDGVVQADELQKRTSEQANAMGMLGEFTGAMGAQIAEPVNYAVVVPGVGAASTLMAKVLAGSVAGGVSEAIIQPNVKEWKNANDIDYTDEDMAFAIATSTAFGGGMGVFGHTIQKGVKALKDWRAKLGEDPRGQAGDEAEAAEAAIKRLEDFSREAESLDLDPDPDLTIGQKLRMLDDKAREKVESNPVMKSEEPDHSARLDEAEEQARFEEALGITREKIEGVDVDPQVSERIIFDESKFDFEINGRSAADVVKNTDAEIKKIDDAINCMMGGGA